PVSFVFPYIYYIIFLLVWQLCGIASADTEAFVFDFLILAYYRTPVPFNFRVMKYTIQIKYKN
ncbi:hypothetical protein, partial [uncultured Ruminococcus sp.]|uniref:hypothetical protein n=1 Tax=uncultured Ruminococcus sp. TaxID=165186 RepID=UPI00258C7268